MHPYRNLYWKLNWYRQSELEGALLLGKMVRQADEPQLINALTKHCADEARHACLWAQTLSTLGLPTIRIFRSYQSYYTEEGALIHNLAEVLAVTHVFEQRVHRQFTDELGQAHLPESVRHTLQVVLTDELQHLDWVARWLKDCRDGEELLHRFRAIDARVHEKLSVYRDRIWDIPGLGEEVAGDQKEEQDAARARRRVTP